MPEHLKIAFTGTHGTGKTTSVYQLAADLKKVRGLPNVGVNLELARGCPFPINKETTPESQLWLTMKVAASEMEAAKSNPILVCDRTIMDAYAYTFAAWKRCAESSDPEGAIMWKRVLDATRPLVQYWLSTYDFIVMKPACDFDYQFGDGLRDLDRDFREEIDRILSLEYSEYLEIDRHITFIRLRSGDDVMMYGSVIGAIRKKFLGA